MWLFVFYDACEGVRDKLGKWYVSEKARSFALASTKC